MVTALKLQNFVALAVGAGQTHGIERRFRSGGDKADLVGAGYRIHDFRGQVNARFIVGKERRAEKYLFLDRGQHLRVAMADEHGAGTEQEVHIFVTADIPNPPAAAFLDHDVRGQIAKTSRRQNPAGQVHQGLLGVATVQLAHLLSPIWGYISNYIGLLQFA